MKPKNLRLSRSIVGKLEALALPAHPFGAEEGLDGGIPENEQVGHNGRYSARGEMRQLRKTL